MFSTSAPALLFRSRPAGLWCRAVFGALLLSGTAFGQFGNGGGRNPDDSFKRVGAADQVDVEVVARPVPSFPLPSEQETRILQALSTTTSVKWDDKPLREALRDLGQQHNFNIWIDLQAMSDAGNDSDQPVALELSDVSLRSCLRLILEPLQLYPVIEDDVMKITTLDKLNLKTTTRVYPVGDLFDTPEEAAQFLESLTCGLGMRADNEGVPRFAVSSRMKTLTVRESYTVQEQVQTLLRALRDAQPAPKPAPKLEDNRKI